jgi:precorrin-2 dehydrogenase/sirohydrochlorin ferrochelatase
MDTFPAFFPLKDRRVVIAGEGAPAEAKARLFAGSPAEIVRLGREEALDPAAYAGADLIFVASFDADFADAAAGAARASGAPLNVVDRPALSDFHTPAIIDRGAVVAGIGTAGAAPLIASLLRAEVEMRVPAAAGKIAALLGSRREALRDAFPDLAERRGFLRGVLAGPVAREVMTGSTDAAARQLDAAIAGGWIGQGRVSLIQSPIEDDLISLRAVRALNVADVVAAATPMPIIDHHARRDAERLSFTDATAESLGALASAGRLVAVLAEAFAPSFVTDLVAAGIVVEHLRAAPAA